ncbi:hypothetical protein [Paenibacillus sp. M-152]|uniref:hypothetical protein n=1 Tax=Paenibacillus sp. M-152 TaxID=2487928 RepID=UPI000F6D8ABB|nr:hypothetical protein [Paenibacillus sp. M-152]AZH30118.1 hypothetical protein EGM68_15785 [Paenibacillus sp. M-152]
MINEGLIHAQQLRRNDSKERVEWAVQFLKDSEGKHAKITAAKIAEISGLSRAVLYKTHLRTLWDTKYSSFTNLGINHDHLIEQQLKGLQDKLAHLELQLEKKEKQLERSFKENEREKLRARVYREDYEELKDRHQKLLYYNLKILRKLHIHGIDTKELDEIHNDFQKPYETDKK